LGGVCLDSIFFPVDCLTDIGPRYADEAAVNAHKVGPKLAWLIETEKKEGNFAAPLEVLPLQQFAGWAAREGAKI
jgi:hypothetical protein